jgi:hypothetical protein
MLAAAITTGSVVRVSTPFVSIASAGEAPGLSPVVVIVRRSRSQLLSKKSLRTFVYEILTGGTGHADEAERAATARLTIAARDRRQAARPRFFRSGSMLGIRPRKAV